MRTCRRPAREAHCALPDGSPEGEEARGSVVTGCGMDLLGRLQSAQRIIAIQR
jgi:hypothetical protein